MDRFALCGGRLFTGERYLDDHAVLIERGVILDVMPAAMLPADAVVRDLEGGLLAPGFIDVQVNGGGGVLFNETRTAAGAAAILAAHRPSGTTGLLPTFITDRPALRQEAVAAIRAAVADGVPGILGLHLEGPFLAAARKGAHDPALIAPLTDADVEALVQTGIPTLLLTLAAEAATTAQIRRLVDGGVIVSIGHSEAPYEVAMAAADAGARGVTHLFNAMSPLSHRAPGVVGAALDHGGFWGGLIADGHHVHPAALRAALRAKQGPGRLFLISDAMPPTGVPGDVFDLTGRRVTRRDGRLLLDDGTLAGADLTMGEAVRFAVDHLGQTPAEALRMASLYPAEFLRLDRERGQIAAGYRADLVLLDDTLTACATWIDGREAA